MHENQPLVSIIMPVYNAERYLSEAIESVLRQTYLDFELLLINDRSTDRSKEICVEYSKKDDRIVLLENDMDSHGPGPTRNIGLDHATGAYLYFMDADDWIEERLLECAVHRMRETNADIVQFGAIYELGNNSCSQPYGGTRNDTLTKDEIRKDFLEFWKEIRTALWLCLFRRETVKSIRFEDIMCGEDASYFMDALCNTEKIAYLGKVFYHYRYVEGSTSHRWDPNIIEYLITIWKHRKNYFDSFQGEIDKLAYAETAYDSYLWAIYYLCSKACPLSYREKKRQLARMKEEIDFEKYRLMCSLRRQHKLEKVKYMLVKLHMERILVLFGPLFLRMIRAK